MIEVYKKDFSEKGYGDRITTQSSSPLEIEIPHSGILVRVYKETYETRELFIYPDSIKEEKVEIKLKREKIEEGEGVTETYLDALAAESEGDLYFANKELKKSLEKYKKGIRILTWLLENKYKDYPYTETKSSMYLSIARMYSKLNNDTFLFLEVEPKIPVLEKLDAEISQLNDQLQTESQILQDLTQEETKLYQLKDKILTDTQIGSNVGVPVAASNPVSASPPSSFPPGMKISPEQIGLSSFKHIEEIAGYERVNQLETNITELKELKERKEDLEKEKKERLEKLIESKTQPVSQQPVLQQPIPQQPIPQQPIPQQPVPGEEKGKQIDERELKNLEQQISRLEQQISRLEQQIDNKRKEIAQIIDRITDAYEEEIKKHQEKIEQIKGEIKKREDEKRKILLALEPFSFDKIKDALKQSLILWPMNKEALFIYSIYVASVIPELEKEYTNYEAMAEDYEKMSEIYKSISEDYKSMATRAQTREVAEYFDTKRIVYKTESYGYETESYRYVLEALKIKVEILKEIKKIPDLADLADELGKKKDCLYYVMKALKTKSINEAKKFIEEHETKQPTPNAPPTAQSAQPPASTQPQQQTKPDNEETRKNLEEGLRASSKNDFYYPDLYYYLGITLAEEVKEVKTEKMPENAKLAIEYVSKAIKEKPILLLAKREAKIPAALYYPSFYPSILLKAETLLESKEGSYPWLEIGIYKELPAEMQNNPEMLYLLGLSYLKLGQYGNAISICNDLTIRSNAGDVVCKILAEILFKKIFEEMPKQEEKKEGGQTQLGAPPVVPSGAPPVVSPGAPPPSP